MVRIHVRPHFDSLRSLSAFGTKARRSVLSFSKDYLYKFWACSSVVERRIGNAEIVGPTPPGSIQNFSTGRSVEACPVVSSALLAGPAVRIRPGPLK